MAEGGRKWVLGVAVARRLGEGVLGIEVVG